MKSNRVLTKVRDVPMLLFLWKWKVATTAALYLKFFRSCKPGRAYLRLWELAQGGFVEQRRDTSGDSSVWALTSKGYDGIRHLLPELRAEGFGCENVGHDLLATAVHLGDWFFEIPEGAEVFTEQELRHFSFDDFPSWVPQTELHRPDGYWFVTLGEPPSTIALEVELTSKRASDYEEVARFYDYYENISRVLWVVPRLSMGNRIRERLNAVSERAEAVHDFVLVDEFSKYGWQATVTLGPDSDKTISQLLQKRAKKDPKMFLAHPMLETRRSPHVSMTYKFLASSQNFD